jgi:hypothetical protein
VLILLQVLVLNQINLFGYLDPYIYVLFILLLPFETPGWLLLLSAFFLGLGIDMFSGTSGIHTAASVLMAFSRPWIIRFIGSTKEIETGMEPGIMDMGFSWFFIYSVILIFIHHLMVFYLEIFTFSEFFMTFLRVVVNTFFTLALIILAQFLFYSKK